MGIAEVCQRMHMLCLQLEGLRTLLVAHCQGKFSQEYQCGPRRYCMLLQYSESMVFPVTYQTYAWLQA
jgi:hypothetical protein